jgi:CubicO group peptidase (beta-lactamase class C family)
MIIVSQGCKKASDNTATPATPGSTVQSDIPVLDSKITAFMSTYNIPGASLAVSKNGKLVYMKGYGFADTAAKEKVTPAYRFRLASVTKTYTGVAIMKLFQDGKLNLDGKVFGTGAILGTDYGTPPYKANLTALTVRMLLQHITGAWGAATGGDVIDQNPAYTNKQLLDWIIDTRPMPNAPGSIFDYSNVNFFILGRIIEKVSGLTYYSYIQSILNSFGATTTDSAGKTLADRKPLEVVYYGQNTDAQFVYTIGFPRRDADAGLISTAKDVLKMVTAVDGFPTRPDILNASTITQFITPSAVFTGYACGIGLWSVENLWFNDGSLPGTRTWFMRDNNGMCVALLLNSRPDTDPGNTFAYAMQAVALDVVKNTSYAWQDIDQFSK